jgi:DNA-binding transcriptional MerR regulator
MGWLKDSISWTHFLSVVRESLEEMKKAIGLHATELQTLRHHNQMMVEKLTQQQAEISRLDRKVESLEGHLRIRVVERVVVEAAETVPLTLLSSKTSSDTP